MLSTTNYYNNESKSLLASGRILDFLNNSHQEVLHLVHAIILMISAFLVDTAYLFCKLIWTSVCCVFELLMTSYVS
jgi:hypothetical protein